jgi:hypothetical protein
MPLKRITPSFTVEHRQAKRPSPGSAKPGWANVRPAAIGLDEKTNRTAMSVFKTVAVQPPADVISPPISSDRILPSLGETAPVTGQADARDAQSRSSGSALQAGHATEAPANRTVARQLREHVYPAEDLEPSVMEAMIPRLEQPTTSRLSAEEARTSRTEKRTQRPAEKQKKLDSSSRTSPDKFETAPMSPTSGLPLPPVDKPSPTTRPSRILGRYVFRDELDPGERWKRRHEARRERRR